MFPGLDDVLLGFTAFYRVSRRTIQLLHIEIVFMWHFESIFFALKNTFFLALVLIYWVSRCFTAVCYFFISPRQMFLVFQGFIFHGGAVYRVSRCFTWFRRVWISYVIAYNTFVCSKYLIFGLSGHLIDRFYFSFLLLFHVCSDVVDESGKQRGLQRTRPLLLRPHEVDADQERLPLQVIRLPSE